MNNQMLMELLILAFTNAEKLMALYRKTQAEKREATDAELAEAAGGDDAARARLQAWIDEQRAKQPPADPA